MIKQAVDDRGQTYLPATSDTIEAQLDQGHSNGPSATPIGRLLRIAVAVILVVVMFALFAHIVGVSWMSAAGAIGTLIGVQLLQYVTIDRKRKHTAEIEYLRRAKHMGHCPGCLNDLTGLVPAADGCTVCPECDAAWRLPNNHEQQQGVSHA